MRKKLSGPVSLDPPLRQTQYQGIRWNLNPLLLSPLLPQRSRVKPSHPSASSTLPAQREGTTKERS